MTKEVFKLIKSMKIVISGWEKEKEQLKEQYESETDVEKQKVLADKIWRITNNIHENKQLIKVIEDDAKTKQQ